jgi:4-hydroxy-tetrahydrodipicolinate synthase
MSQTSAIRGVLSPVVTPFTKTLAPDAERLTAHCQWLIDNDVGLAVFGTNSEANSLSITEKRQLLDHLVAAGLPAGKMMPGSGACALTDAVELTNAAVAHGCAGVLMLPPFYYKGVSDDGLFNFYSEVIQKVGSSKLRIYLYHIPQVSNVPITFSLIEKLLKEYPGTIAGIKDSSGDWDNTRGMLENFQPQGFDVFAGSETFLLATLNSGGAGCISATANVNPAAIANLAAHYQDANASELQTQLDAVRDQFTGYVMISGMKAVIAHHKGDSDWIRVRPPLTNLTAKEQKELVAALDEIGFSMPGLT